MTELLKLTLAGSLLCSAIAAASEPTQDENIQDDKTASLNAQHTEGADEESLQIYDEIEIRERGSDLVGIASSANEGSTGYEDLHRRPILRPGELVETTPGVIATQHSGGGKANQYFLRGFNLDHGTDFSVWVAGAPVNMPTHGHGQGYADLNFLIPELVERVRFRKGPYYASKGDFSAAGGIDMEVLRSLPERLVSLTGGSYEYGRALWAQSFKTEGSGDLLAALDLFHNNGPWTRGEDYDGVKALLKYSRGDAQRGYSVIAMGYDADWLSTDQVPMRAVDSGLIDRFDLIDPGPRGATSRYSLSAELHRGDARSLTSYTGYLLAYDFNLISNFTYFLEDPENGDQFEQIDERSVGGFDIHHFWLTSWGGKSLENSAGIGFRYDDIQNGLFRTRDLDRITTTRQDDIAQLTGGPWAETLIHWSDKVRTRLGLRGDFFSVDVKSNLAANSGTEDDFLMSPKFSLILGPWNKTEFYVNFGYGFHSNDGRGATIQVDPVTGERVESVEPLVRAEGFDLGFRTTAIQGLHTTVTLYQLKLDSELVFVGDGGATESSRPSRRRGIEITNFYQITRWLALDLDFTLTDAEFTDGDPAGPEIPNAVGETLALGLSVHEYKNFFGALRWRYFSDIALIEDNSARWGSSSLVNGSIGYHFENGLSLSLEIFNLLDSDDSDIQYFYASRLPGEPQGGIEDIHLHPFERRSVRLVAAWRR